MQLGIVTYMIAAKWSLQKILSVLGETRIRGVELRTTHAHGVEASLSPRERTAVRRMFEEAGVRPVGLGTAFEFDSPDPKVVRKNLEGAKQYVELAHDIGAEGIKVRPNRLHEDKGIPAAATLRQIGEALHELGEYAQGFGVKVRVEVHGRGTSLLPNMKRIMDVANHPAVVVCWNCNRTDIDNPQAPPHARSIRRNFGLVKRWVEIVHIHDLYDEQYPYGELFELLKSMRFTGWTLAEIPACHCDQDAVRLLRYYRALWQRFARS